MSKTIQELEAEVAQLTDTLEAVLDQAERERGELIELRALAASLRGAVLDATLRRAVTDGVQ